MLIGGVARRILRLFVGCALITTASATQLVAQGLSGASIEGNVRTDNNIPVAGAVLTLTSVGTGFSRRASTDERGVFRFDEVPVDYYRLEAKALGYAPTLLDSIALHLGDRTKLTVTLNRGVRELNKVVVNDTRLTNSGAGGAAQSIPRKAIANLPIMDRNFVGLFAASSQALGPGSLWVSGQHSRFNSIQIDGGIGNNLFGTDVAPGSSAGGKSISLDAIQEIRILVSPFDVRQGGFSGGLINAITRSGTNDTRVSVTTSYARSTLVGSDASGADVPHFDQVQYGLTAGGPIIRDRLHYFISAEAQSKASQFDGPLVDDSTTGITRSTADRVTKVFRDRFGFDPGDANVPDLSQPNSNLFAKLSWNASRNNLLELTQSFEHARSDVLNRLLRSSNNSDGWELTNSGWAVTSTSFSTRLKMTSGFGSLHNEAMASISGIDDRIASHTRAPLFLIQDALNNYIAAGSVKGAQDVRTTQRVLEFTDNLSKTKGNHTMTIGTQDVLDNVDDNFVSGLWGVWTFSSITALENNQPSRYEVALRSSGDGPIARAHIAMTSAYAQDIWQPLSRLEITTGLRVDAPFLNSPRSNKAFAASDKFGGADTGVSPSGNVVFSPRVGFSVDIGESHRSMLRGGVGVFAGRPPLSWLTSAYSSTGLEQTTLVCVASSGVPAPTADITALPTHCSNQNPTGAKPAISFYDPAFKFQRAIKYSIGLDHRFGGSVLTSVDALHVSSRDNLFVNDLNLVPQGFDSEGRAIYGTISPTGVAKPSRLDSAYDGVFRYSNVNSDRFSSLSASVQRSWSSGGLLQLAYTWSHAEDVIGLTGFTSVKILQSNPVDGTLAHRNLRRSARDIPHSAVAVAIVPMRFGVMSSLFFHARSGAPYAFTVNSDANADGTNRNDLAYVPRSLNDFSLANPEVYPALDSLIESQDCLRAQRGRIMRRNSCRNPAVFSLDGRIAKTFSVPSRRGIEISADLFNLPNMLHTKWGIVRETSNREDVPLMSVTGWDAANRRPLYSIPVVKGTPVLPQVNKIVSDASRWRVQVGARINL